MLSSIIIAKDYKLVRSSDVEDLSWRRYLGSIPNIGGVGKNSIECHEVSGPYMRDNFDANFCSGGHWLWKDYIPNFNVYVEQLANAVDESRNLAHEIIESILMLLTGIPYDPAHDAALAYEGIQRLFKGSTSDLLSNIRKFNRVVF